MSVTEFPHLTIWSFAKGRPCWISGWFKELFKETSGKNLGFCFEKERESKKRNG